MTTDLVVSAAVADVRRDPDPTSELVTQALMNRPARAAESVGEWTHVTLSDYAGWIRSAELEEPITPAFCKVGERCATPLQMVAVVGVPRTALYARAEGDETQGNVYLSTPLHALDTTHEARIQVALPGERAAWLERASCELRTHDEPYPRRPLGIVIDCARSLLGVPYLWGGTSYEGIDCSGFVQLCYRMGGYIIPRDADQQHDFLQQSVEREQMRAGDLIFFGSERITHVGMALNDHEYIHAEGRDFNRVVINSFREGDPHFNTRLVNVVRAIKRVVCDADA